VESPVIAKHYVLAAGGTGGHMVPAHALAEELMRRGHRVALVTDERGARIPGLFGGVQVHTIPAGRLTGQPHTWIPGIRAVMQGRRMAMRMFDAFEPSVVVGFGGYPAFPALLAAFRRGVPTVVHEQNAVLGRVNRLCARRVDAIATSFAETQRIKPGWASKTHLVGNPVREDIVAIRDQPFPPLDDDGIFRVLVTGGSQGASVLSRVVPDGLALLPVILRRRLQVTQQCRAEDIDAVRMRYEALGIPADLQTYMTDLPERLSWAHLVIGRAGASTICELTAAGRPAILIPLPSATDDHQTHNAAEMVAAGGARMVAQHNFTPVELAKQMQKLGLDPDALANAAKRAKSCGRPDATRDLATLVERFGPAVDPPAAAAFKPVLATAKGAA
jgi:UDP-N-acetylglucosamine--N-acetylmuramyl-(pentapeptide) pyrophosphoryl-undecaprenol N-acetylglucosamine transferase